MLESHLQGWLRGPRAFPLTLPTCAALDGLTTDLRRQAEALEVDRPILVIMLMGGTGVGKSTLLNALAGGAIAQASFARPTTRDPVVYYHESIKPDRLDPALQHCRLAPHKRAALDQKILVDTPDLDSNDLANREKLSRLLPIADVVLYVGSQEKYHDKLGWDLFRHQRRRRAFAFILNKWDRCLQSGSAGLRPDEDLLRDLQAEGFQEPLLFRTCAQLWAETTGANGAPAALEPSGDPDDGSAWAGRIPADLPDGEQFSDLVRWLESGLTRMEIEAIKARGISQLLQQLQETLETATPPDLAEAARQARQRWETILEEEAQASSEILLNTLEPYQREIEHHFSVEGQRRFRGLMAGYLRIFTRMKYVGSTLRDRLPFLVRPGPKVQTPETWDLSRFTTACTNLAGERHLDARCRAMASRLLVESENVGFPLELLAPQTEAAAVIDWRQRFSKALIEVLHVVEQKWANPTGLRRPLQKALIWLADWAPPLSLLAGIIRLLWLYFMGDSKGQSYKVEFFDILLPGIVCLAVLIILHILIALLMPMRWPALRGEFHRELRQRLELDLKGAFASIPADVAEVLRRERGQVEALAQETRDLAQWLDERVQSSEVRELYGRGARHFLSVAAHMAEGKWISELAAATPVAEAAREALSQRLRVVRLSLGLALQKPQEDPESIHQVRVGTRRAVAALEIFVSCFPPKIYRSTRKRLRRLRRAAGQARDWDVFLIDLDNRRRRTRTGRNFDFLCGYALGQRSAAQAHLEANCLEWPEGFNRLQNQLLESTADNQENGRASTLLELARPLLASLLQELNLSAKKELHDYEHLHQVRIIGKRLRYTMEVAAFCFPPSFRDELYPQIEEMQDMLGRANDSHVASQRLTALRNQLQKAGGGTWNQVKEEVEEFLRYHTRRLAQERRRFLKWYTHWETSGSDAQFKDLLKKENE